MRVVTLLVQFLIAVASGGALAWWASTIGMRLLVRRLERNWPLRAGPLPACAALIVLCALVFSVVVTVIAWSVFGLLIAAADWANLPWPWAIAVWQVLTIVATVILALAGIWAAFQEAMVAWGSARRRRYLTGTPPNQAEPEAVPSSAGRRIVILCDGTSNRPDQQEDGEAAATNVWKLYKALGCDETQITWYQPGIGSDSSSTAAEARRTQAILSAVGANPGSQVAAYWRRFVQIFESAFGQGISESIANGYAEIVREYQPGDRIYLIGFSRGAYTARCIAGIISRCGLLRAENLRYAGDMVQLFRTREHPDDVVSVRSDLVHADPAVEFVGVFDTVASLGVPLWGWWFRASPIWKNKALATDPVEACRHVYHALAMDERRSQFFPTLYQDPRRVEGIKRSASDKLETLEQVWFRGAHADIGGGYARHDLSDISLGWMMDAMEQHGLRFQANARADLRPDPLGRRHDELEREPGWVLFGTWPRWHPVPGHVPDHQGTTLHSSVFERAETILKCIGRPDLVTLANGESLNVVVEARQDWSRTGIIIEPEAYYCLTYLDGLWRDAEAPPCTPYGQQAEGWFDLRRYLTQGRRLRYEPWMRLIATIAHPRHWALKEKGLPELIKLLFHNDPQKLTKQLAPIGKNLGWPNDSIILYSKAPAGMLYMFANDWWQTASNNSGGIRIRITRIEKVNHALPIWILNEDGTWSESGETTYGNANIS